VLLRRLVLALGILSALAILVGTAYDLWRSRTAALERTETRLQDLARVLGEQTERAMGQLDSILTAIAEDAARRARSGGLRAGRTLHDELRRYDSVPQLEALAILDPSGYSVASSGAFPPPSLDHTDRDYFRVHSERTMSGSYLSMPLASRVNGRLTVAMSRRVPGSPGKPPAVVVAYVKLGYFTDLYRSLDLGKGGGIRLFHRDGPLLAGDPIAPEMGAALVTTPAQRALSPGTSSLFEIADMGDGRPGLIVVCALRDQPLVVTARSATDHVLAAWRESAWSVGAMGTIAAAAIFAAAVVLERRMKADERHRQAHEELEARRQEEEARLTAIVQSAMDAIVTVDSARRIVLFNEAAERLFGIGAQQAIGASLDTLIPERFRAAHRTHVERFGRTGETSRRMGKQAALWALRADGTEFPMDASISQVSVAGQQLFSVILRDISARLAAEAEIERSHAQLRELGAAMHEVRETERTRIARELHDELGQMLTALRMDVDMLEAICPSDRSDLLERTAAMRELLGMAVSTTRRISADLRPLVLDDLGLVPAAEWLVQNLGQRSNLACELEIDPALGGLGEPYASALYRVMQESLTNVAKHAQASRVEIRLARDGNAAMLTVRDDGIGMDQHAESKPRSFGLRGIRERVLVLGGEVQVVSRPGAGTTIVVRIPLRAG
jgi:PAS domain S-box-containing protein